MRFFKKKEPIKPDFEARLTQQEQKIKELRREMVEVVMDIENLRDKVLRKIQSKRKLDKEEDTAPPLDGLPRMNGIQKSVL